MISREFIRHIVRIIFQFASIHDFVTPCTYPRKNTHSNVRGYDIRFFNIDNAFSLDYPIQWRSGHPARMIKLRRMATKRRSGEGVGSGLNLDKPSHEFRNYTLQLCMCVYTYIRVFCRIKKRKKGGEMNLLLRNIAF